MTKWMNMGDLKPHRPFSKWESWRIGLKYPIVKYSDPLTADLLWDLLNLLANVPKKGEALFTQDGEQTRKWDNLNDFVRQAKAYYDALTLTRGTARALLGYYSSLNLAKAELLHTAPERVLDTKIHHGLSFNIATAEALESDRVRVLDGVFPLLYKARTGVELENSTMLSVKGLLARIPELGSEYYEFFDESTRSARVWAALLVDESHYWLALLFNSPSDLLMQSPEWSRLNSGFEQVAVPSNYKSFFVDAPYRPADLCMYQQREPRQLTGGGGLVPSALFEDLTDCLGASVNNSFERQYGFDFTPGLDDVEGVPMPAFLARYVLMFYLSSLVRYRPSRLNPERLPLDSWLLESFARQSPMYLLADALDGIAKRTHRYEH